MYRYQFFVPLSMAFSQLSFLKIDVPGNGIEGSLLFTGLISPTFYLYILEQGIFSYFVKMLFVCSLHLKLGFLLDILREKKIKMMKRQ
jgi:hypothetical protein